MLHLAPRLGCVDYNRSLVESGVDLAAEQGADWVLTPELCVPGYTFTPHIGTDWILAQPDEWNGCLMAKARNKGVTVFLSHPERDPQTGLLHNSVFVIGPGGDIMGCHRKIKVNGRAPSVGRRQGTLWWLWTVEKARGGAAGSAPTPGP